MKPFLERVLIEARKIKHTGSILSAYINSMLRLSAIKHIEIYSSSLEKDTNLEEVTQLFNLCLENTNKICKENNYKGFEAIALVREGIFFKDTTKINSGLKTLQEMGKENIVDGFKREIKNLFGVEEV